MAKRKDKSEDAAGRFVYERLDRVLHERARLSILTALTTRPDGLLFTELRELCSMTDGNLSRHVQVLQEAELVQVWKRFEGRRPQTLVRMSKAGRRQFLEYLEELERVLGDARMGPRSERRSDQPPTGWTLA